MQQKEVCALQLRNINKLRLERAVCDINILVGEAAIPAHKVILAASSTFFKKALSGTETNMYRVHGVTTTDFVHVLDFLYTGQMLLNKANVESMKAIACALQMELLLEYCNTWENGELIKKQKIRNSDAICKTKGRSRAKSVSSEQLKRAKIAEDHESLRNLLALSGNPVGNGGKLTTVISKTRSAEDAMQLKLPTGESQLNNQPSASSTFKKGLANLDQDLLQMAELPGSQLQVQRQHEEYIGQSAVQDALDPQRVPSAQDSLRQNGEGEYMRLPPPYPGKKVESLREALTRKQGSSQTWVNKKGAQQGGIPYHAQLNVQNVSLLNSCSQKEGNIDDLSLIQIAQEQNIEITDSAVDDPAQMTQNAESASMDVPGRQQGVQYKLYTLLAKDGQVLGQKVIQTSPGQTGDLASLDQSIVFSTDEVVGNGTELAKQFPNVESITLHSAVQPTVSAGENEATARAVSSASNVLPSVSDSVTSPIKKQIVILGGESEITLPYKGASDQLSAPNSHLESNLRSSISTPTDVLQPTASVAMEVIVPSESRTPRSPMPYKYSGSLDGAVTGSLDGSVDEDESVSDGCTEGGANGDPEADAGHVDEDANTVTAVITDTVNTNTVKLLVPHNLILNMSERGLQVMNIEGNTLEGESSAEELNKNTITFHDYCRGGGCVNQAELDNNRNSTCLNTTEPDASVADLPVGRSTSVSDSPLGRCTGVADSPVGRSASVADSPVGRSTGVSDSPVGRSTSGSDSPVGRSTSGSDSLGGTNVTDSSGGTNVADSLVGTSVADLPVGTREPVTTANGISGVQEHSSSFLCLSARTGQLTAEMPADCHGNQEVREIGSGCSRVEKGHHQHHKKSISIRNQYTCRKKPCASYQCDWCKNKYSSLGSLRDHARQNHAESLFSCNYCSRTFLNEVKCDNHMDRCRIRSGANGRYQCPLCEYNSKKLNYVVNHYRGEHTQKHFRTCDVCGAAFHGLINFYEHQLVVHDVNVTTEYQRKIHQCNLCSYRTVKVHKFKTHKQNHSLTRYKCSLCSKLFKTEITLQKHMQSIHQDAVEYRCAVCDFKSKYKATLLSHLYRAHQIVTSVKKIYFCHYCDYSHVDQADLKKHERNCHSDEKPFSCAYCSKAFKHKTQLNIHERAHTGEKPYKCGVCCYAGRSKAALSAHMRHSHSDEKPYQCDLCGFRTKGPSNLWLHRRRCKKRMAVLEVKEDLDSLEAEDILP